MILIEILIRQNSQKHSYNTVYYDIHNLFSQRLIGVGSFNSGPYDDETDIKPEFF